jgi:hypothetical protein
MAGLDPAIHELKRRPQGRFFLFIAPLHPLRDFYLCATRSRDDLFHGASMLAEGNSHPVPANRTDDHPVWGVYDKLRTACLNVKYFSRRLQFFERLNFTIEFIIAATAPTSAITGLWFWKTDFGQVGWKYLAVVAAAAAVSKPLLNLTKRIKEYESILSGYRTLEYDLRQIRTLVEQKRKYDKALQNDFLKAVERERALVAKNPETREATRLKRKCEEEVLRAFPVQQFYIPKEENHGE